MEWHVYPQTTMNNVSVWSDMFTLRLLWLWISIMCLCGVTCLPSDCCGSESEYCVCVEWHVYPQTAVALNQYNVSVWSDMFTLRLLWLEWYNVSVWSDMFTLRLLWLWISIMCLCGVTCLPSDCCGSESECLCGVTCLPSDCCGSESDCVEWHVYPQTAVALNQYNVSVWSDMFTLRVTTDWNWYNVYACLPSE